jgi:tetratricopeptide (TPR) repeat protein
MDSAKNLLLCLLQDSRALRSRTSKAIALGNMSSVLCELGEFQLAHETAQEGLRIAKGTGDGRAEAFAHRGARAAAQELGQWAQALAHARSAQAGFVSNGHQTHAWVESSMAARGICEAWAASPDAESSRM